MKVVVVGGGLSGGLLALRLAQHRINLGNSLGDDLDFELLEAGPTLGGNHTWSFHSTDLEGSDRDWVLPLVSKTWPNYVVQFPDVRREIPVAYHSIRSEDFHSKLMKVLGNRVRLNCPVVELQDKGVGLESGEFIDADVVIDARGGMVSKAGRVAYQKFIGLDVKLKNPHFLKRPILMDATCDQSRGYRFFYVLPWDDERVLIEDTYYSSEPHLDESQIEAGIQEYASAKGWEFAEVTREEKGVLPLPLLKDYKETAPSLVIGMASGYFHPTTGYSLPFAAKMAREISLLPDLRSTPGYLKNTLKEWEEASGFYRLLNRMLFWAAEPEKRYRVLERFFKLSDSIIIRFFAGDLGLADRARILSGKPPVPLRKAMKCLRDEGGVPVEL